MARILTKGTWFEPLSVSSLYEGEFETLLLQNSQVLFPNYYLVPFKKTVYAEQDSAKADLALIDKYYREWWVVEVELGHHSFNGHVLPQVQTLARAQYTFLEAKYLSEQADYLALERLEDMMKGIQPRVLVILNQSRSTWVEPLKRFDALVAVVEPYSSMYLEYLFQVSGEIPRPASAFASECHVHPYIPGFLVIKSPAALNVKSNENVRIIYKGEITPWQRTDIKDSVFLVFKGKENPLKENTPYVMLTNSDGDLEIRAKEAYIGDQKCILS